jgi:glutamate dehydrogenase/leucine dehydrogenase
LWEAWVFGDYLAESGGLILAEDIWVGRIKRKSMGESELDKNLVKMMEVGCSVCRDRRMKKKD